MAVEKIPEFQNNLPVPPVEQKQAPKKTVDVKLTKRTVDVKLIQEMIEHVEQADALDHRTVAPLPDVLYQFALTLSKLFVEHGGEFSLDRLSWLHKTMTITYKDASATVKFHDNNGMKYIKKDKLQVAHLLQDYGQQWSRKCAIDSENVGYTVQKAFDTSKYPKEVSLSRWVLDKNQ